MPSVESKYAKVEMEKKKKTPIAVVGAPMVGHAIQGEWQGQSAPAPKNHRSRDLITGLQMPGFGGLSDQLGYQ